MPSPNLYLSRLKSTKRCKNPSDISCECTKPTGDTNLDLKGSAFVPIAGILKLVDRTLVNGVSLLTWRKKRGKMKEKEKEEKK